jgi:hypothetical protein
MRCWWSNLSKRYFSTSFLRKYLKKSKKGKNFEKLFWMLWFVVHFDNTRNQFGAFLMPLRLLLNQSPIPPLILKFAQIFAKGCRKQTKTQGQPFFSISTPNSKYEFFKIM